MSGPLRRTKRSRPADGGEPLEEGLSAEPEGAPTTPETPPAGDATAAPVAPGEPAAAKQPPAEATSADDAASPEVTGQEPPVEAVATEPLAPPASSQGAGAEPPPASVGSVGAAGRGANEPRAAAPGSEPTAEFPSADTAPAGDSRRRRWRPFRHRGKRTPVTEQTQPQAPPPVLLADPSTPAGLDPAEAPMRPPAGRRGRLRRRLRYLRRARELMLRDLGGLLYEVHRTGGGSVDSHATVIGAKVQRIAGLDAEAHALETALGAPRGETVVFEPGVGGTCDTCGELYGSDAKFCSNCGASVGTGAPSAPAAGATAAASAEADAGAPARRAFWRRAARPAEDPPSGETAVSTPVASPPSGDEQTAVSQPAASPPDESAASGDERTAVLPPDATAGRTDAATPGEQPAAPRDDRPTPGAEAAAQPPAEASPKPLPGLRNGRPDDRTPPGLSSGDPLVSRERP
ncbi:MAG TPA: hypothetical protein VK631_07600 [Solirubrobacteraceae bacterium]|nr:hypothetical protein [Solirubrobacteraceae bacterium]